MTRVRLDAELKQIVATATEKERAEGGDRAAHEAKLAAAQALGLHVVNHDQVLYPDAQLDIEDADGRSGRVNVEIVSDHYHAAAITAKAAAGFAMHGSSRSATRKIARALARESDRGGGDLPWDVTCRGVVDGIAMVIHMTRADGRRFVEEAAYVRGYDAGRNAWEIERLDRKPR